MIHSISRHRRQRNRERAEIGGCPSEPVEGPRDFLIHLAFFFGSYLRRSSGSPVFCRNSIFHHEEIPSHIVLRNGVVSPNCKCTHSDCPGYLCYTVQPKGQTFDFVQPNPGRWTGQRRNVPEIAAYRCLVCPCMRETGSIWLPGTSR
jgi:hypothetical protein